jgi:hypothetical protein
MFKAANIQFLYNRLSATSMEPLFVHVGAVVDFPIPSKVKKVQGDFGHGILLPCQERRWS